ncbi:hypothetical protein KA977_02720 [Candidatus Dependentiae bacterium]|nr:hypothetical protein [Candidatus Dependentiae bacterium]
MLFILVLGGIVALSAIPSIMFFSATKKFDIIQNIFSQLTSSCYAITVILALITLSSHIKNRSVKMIITKPCSAEIWTLSILISGLIFIIFFYSVILISILGLSLFWSIPIQKGMILVLFEKFYLSFVLFALFTFLSVLFHPAIALILGLSLNESTFYHLCLSSNAGLKISSGIYKQFYKILEQILFMIYYCVPSLSPYEKFKGNIYLSYIIEPDKLKYFGYTFLYYSVLIGLFYFLTLIFLKKKRLI